MLCSLLSKDQSEVSAESTFLIIKHPAMFITNHKGSLFKSYRGLCFHNLFSDSVSWKIYMAFATESHALQKISPRSICCYNAKVICKNSVLIIPSSRDSEMNSFRKKNHFNLSKSCLDLKFFNINTQSCMQLQKEQKQPSDQLKEHKGNHIGFQQTNSQNAGIKSTAEDVLWDGCCKNSVSQSSHGTNDRKLE